MRARFCFIVFTFCICSCESEAEFFEEIKKEVVFVLPDSIDTEKIIAIYKEDVAHTILVYHSREKKGVRKITYRPGFPVFVDSLSVIAFNEFRSRKFTTTYLVCDTSVTSVYDLKVIHPSSNWQGQTPGREPIVTVFKRLNK